MREKRLSWNPNIYNWSLIRGNQKRIQISKIMEKEKHHNVAMGTEEQGTKGKR